MTDSKPPSSPSRPPASTQILPVARAGTWFSPAPARLISPLTTTPAPDPFDAEDTEVVAFEPWNLPRWGEQRAPGPLPPPAPPAWPVIATPPPPEPAPASRARAELAWVLGLLALVFALAYLLGAATT